MIITGEFERFHYFNFILTNFLQNENWAMAFNCKYYDGKQDFHVKLYCQKPMLRQIEWEMQNGPITRNWVLPICTLLF